MLLEIAAFSLADALAAQKAGADRIEFCNNYLAGGITCNTTDLEIARQKISIPLYAIIRPRAGNFVYNTEEFLLMKSSIILCKTLGYNGIVLGILKENNTIDFTRTKELVELAYPLPVTFHRAFDHDPNVEIALNAVIKTGCKKILTSGGKKTAFDGANEIKKMIDWANNKITILPGGGIRSNHITQLANTTKAKEYHSACIDENSSIINVNELRLLKEKLNAFN